MPTTKNNLNSKKVPLIVKQLEDNFEKLTKHNQEIINQFTATAEKMTKNREEENKLRSDITIFPSHIGQEGRIATIVRNELKKAHSKSKKKNTLDNIILENNFITHKSQTCELEGKIQMAILKKLTKEFTETHLLCEKVGSKDSDSTRKAIAVINRKGKYSLHLKDNIIEGSRGQGYRIREKYKITFH